MKGKYSLNLNADGKYFTKEVVSGLRKKKDTVIASIPSFYFTSTFLEFALEIGIFYPKNKY